MNESKISIKIKGSKWTVLSFEQQSKQQRNSNSTLKMLKLTFKNQNKLVSL